MCIQNREGRPYSPKQRLVFYIKDVEDVKPAPANRQVVTKEVWTDVVDNIFLVLKLDEVVKMKFSCILYELICIYGNYNEKTPYNQAKSSLSDRFAL